MVRKAQISPAKCRAARGLLGWTQQALADAAGVGLSTLRDFETGNANRSPPSAAKVEAIRDALAAAGVEFLSGRRGDGVRLASASASGAR